MQCRQTTHPEVFYNRPPHIPSNVSLPWTNTKFLAPNHVYPTNSVFIGSVVLAQLTHGKNYFFSEFHICCIIEINFQVSVELMEHIFHYGCNTDFAKSLCFCIRQYLTILTVTINSTYAIFYLITVRH